MRGVFIVLAGLGLSATPGAQDPVHFPPANRITVRVMTDVPGVMVSPGFLMRTIVGATGSFSFSEFENGAGAALHHHTREQANVGIEGVMEMGLGTHAEPLPVGAGVITPANVRHAIRNRSGGKLVSLEFHTIQRPDLAPPRPRPAVPYPVAPEPVAIPDTSRLVVQLDAPEHVGKAIKGETCTLAWRQVKAGAPATDLVPTRAGVELFVYVVSGEADLAGTGVAQRVSAGTMILIPASEQHVTLKAAGQAGVSLVEFRPGPPSP